LGVSKWISTRAAITETNQQIACVVDEQLSAIVIRIGLLNEQQRSRCCEIRAIISDFNADDVGVAIEVGEVGVELIPVT
jgi:hypothetical protein